MNGFQKQISIYIVLFLAIGTSRSQRYCGIDLLPFNYIGKNYFQLKDNKISYDSSIIQVPVKMHVVRTDSGIGGLSATELNTWVSQVNDYYVSGNIEFVVCGDINYIDETEFYHFDYIEEASLADINDVDSLLNVYIPRTVSYQGLRIYGYSYYGWDNINRIFVEANTSADSSLLEHELAHQLSLYHTHGTSNFGTTDELVNGSNCVDSGDEICDTPADPNLSIYGSIDNISCLYNDSLTDSNGNIFSPLVNNIMSYAPLECTSAFTIEQYNRMYQTAVVRSGEFKCLDATSSINDKNLTHSLIIYPNPIKSEFFIKNEYKIEWLQIYSISGKLLKEYKINKLQEHFSCPWLNNGIYYFRIKSGEKVFVKTLVVNKI